MESNITITCLRCGYSEKQTEWNINHGDCGYVISCPKCGYTEDTTRQEPYFGKV
jgi:predicted nucleic-acid-binding Zn-ribbon protein